MSGGRIMLSASVDERVIGRQAELAALDEILTRISSGLACVAIEGEAGAGKTTVWQEAIRRAKDKGINVLACRPAAAETRMAFAALGDLLDPIGDEALEHLPGPQRHALEVALLRAADDGSPPGQRAIGVAFLSLVRHLAASSAVLLAVDDAQWLDAPSAGVLEFALRRLLPEPVGVLVTVRLTAEPSLRLDRAVDEGRRTTLRLKPMSMSALHEVLSLRLGHVFPRPTLVKITQASGGNPFYALEIARELVRVGVAPAGVPLPVSDDLRQLVTARIRRFPSATRQALLTAAALSHPSTEVIDIATLGPAEQADVIRVRSDGSIVFSHPLYAAAVYESTPAARRRALHRELANVVEELDERARHMALATTAADEDVARMLEDGARHARARGAWQSAAELLEQARALTPADRPDDAARRGIAAAEHHAHAGDRARASSLLEELIEWLPGGSLRADALRLLGEVRYHAESFREAVRLFENAAQNATEPGLLAEIELDLAYAAYQASPDEAAAVAVRIERALELAASSGDDGLHAQALALHTLSEYILGRGIAWDRLAQALALEDTVQLIPLQRTPSAISAQLLLYAGRLSDARDRLTAVRQSAIDRGDESDLSYFLSLLAWLESQAGNLVAAQAYAEEATFVASLTGGKSMLAFASSMDALVGALRGDIDGARTKCDEATLLSRQTTFRLAGEWIVAARCLAELSVDNMAGVWRAAERVMGYWEANPIRGPVGMWFLPDVLEALIALGELDRAATFLGPFQTSAERLDRVWGLATSERCRGLLFAAGGDLTRAVEHFQAALIHHARLDMPFELGRTLMCLGQVQRRRKLRRDAREALRQALEIFERIGTPLWAAKTRAELDRTHVREAPSGLTPSEQTVAELAASGLTNKQIAKRLFMSPKTVESNLVHIYAKLNIGSRAELGARMATLN